MGILQRLYDPEPAPDAFAGGAVMPEASASMLSRWTFSWISPLLWVGYTRPLQKEDLWEMPERRKARQIADAFAFEYERARLRSRLKRQAKGAKNDGEDPGSATDWSNQLDLLRALYACYWASFWAIGVLQALSTGLALLSPLLTERFLSYLTAAYFWAKVPGSPPPPSVEYGMALAASLPLVKFIETLIQTQNSQVSVRMSMSASSALNRNVFEKSLRVSGRARVEHTKGQIISLFSQDTSQVIHITSTVHTLAIEPIQLIVGVFMLVRLLGVAAWVGLGVILVTFPIQAALLSYMMGSIIEGMKVHDKRIRVMQEVLQGIRSIKIYAWERFFAGKIGTHRAQELSLYRFFSLRLSYLHALLAASPVLCAALAFVTYSLTGHDLTPATVFTALQVFTLIEGPLISVPMSASTIMTFKASLERLSKFLNAEEVAEPFPVEPELADAVRIDADFTWEESAAADPDLEAMQAQGVELTPGTPATPKPPPFVLKDLKMTVARGAFVALVGQVGAGKSSVMEAIAGEMRKTRGEVVLGGAVAYAPQAPWIVNGTLKDNIVFDTATVDEGRYTQCVRACALEHDLAMLAHGDRTEIGERGINLSGGQKARVSLARVAYSQADIVLLDDPLSAVDAYVGKHILRECLLMGPLSERTRVLATHALHVLPYVDYIYVLEKGTIVEQGTYEQLRSSGGAFARLLEEHGTKAQDLEKEAEKLEEAPEVTPKTEETQGISTALIQEEDRDVGQVPWSTYRDLLVALGVWFIPLLLLLAIALHAVGAASTLALSWWSSQRFPGWTNRDYIALYVSLGCSVALFASVKSFAFMAISLRAGGRLFQKAMDHVLRSPVVFFDTTPMGRIISRLTKDISTIDRGVGLELAGILDIPLSIITTLSLVLYTFPVVGAGFIPLALVYFVYFSLYRRTAVEMRRLESICRSATFNSYNETLSGLSTVRATRQAERFIRRTEDAIDLNNKAHYLSVVVSQWLHFRLSVLGDLVTLGISLYAVTKRSVTNPADIAVVLNYALMLTNTLSAAVHYLTGVEQEMASVQRILAYTELPVEGEGMTLHAPPESWPSEGAIELKNVDLAYRPGLPDVLRDVSFTVKPGEKVGICGRTGAGKSTILQALLRLFEIKRGSIIIDNQDIGLLDIEGLRTHLGVIPQESVFMGTLRESIDPLKSRTDAELLEILQHAHLVSAQDSNDLSQTRFALDSSLGAEGSALSAGEKQQLALCRVLVKRCKVVILDEATSSVDLETDAKLQQTIRAELASSTLLCIAHRLNTILSFDKVLVMDKGQVAEFDQPLALYDKGGIFFSLCKEASIGRDDIIRLARGGQPDAEPLINLEQSE
ncbi:P-loop containing nucleoside triphosphate hydrolase protein [Auricularia subglabra TFB-10046 SS5]|nr:P-loop containing nucleoside triphosphate hydrolase protein [Auricularia subglabra TFB-10046 SS5]